MKKLFFILMLAVIPAVISAQPSLTVNSHFIKLDRVGLETHILFTKDIYFAYDANNLYFTTKISNGGWEFTVKYSTISSYNGVVKGDLAFPSFAAIKTQITDSIAAGKHAGG